MLNEKELKDKLETIKKVFEEDEDLLQDNANLKESVELEFSEIAEAIEEIVESKVRKALTRLSEEFDSHVDNTMRKVTEALELVSDEMESNKEDIMCKVTEALELVSERIENDKKVVTEAFGLVCDRIEGKTSLDDDCSEDVQLDEKQDFSEYIDYRLGFLKEDVSYNKLEQIRDLLNENEFNSEAEVQEFFDTLEETVHSQKHNTLNEEHKDDFVSACSSMLK